MCTSNSKPVKKLGLAVHPIHQMVDEAVNKLEAACEKLGIGLVPVDGDSDLARLHCDAIASVGGDGTLLGAVRLAMQVDIPVWGINVGHLGYLTTCGIDRIESGMERLMKGEYTVDQRATLEASGENHDGTKMNLIALNDIVVRRTSGTGLLILDSRLDDRFLSTFECDGLIVSTPTGSTAYSLSAGGSILSPDLQAFIITPICSHSLSSRSLVVDDESVLSVHPRFNVPGRVVHVIADGQVEAKLSNPYEQPDTCSSDACRIIIKKSKQKACLIRFGELFFSDVLREKLGWAGGRSYQPE